MTNTAQGEAECYICHETLIKNCILSYKRGGSVLSVLFYFTLIEVSSEYSSLVILTCKSIEQFPLIKCVSDLSFYKYFII